MKEIFKLLIGTVFLALGIPVGELLKKMTLDEQRDGQKWFRMLVTISLLIGLYGLIIQVDWILFTFFFIAIVTSRSLIPKKISRKKVKRKKK